MGGIKKNLFQALDPLHIGLARGINKKKKSAPAATPQVQPTMDDASVQAALDEQQRRRLAAQRQGMTTALTDSTTTADSLG